MTRLLIVDDSALMRLQLARIFESEPDFEVHTARNGREALDALETFRPDVITLDIHMPEMDGLTALAHIMTKRPCPVVMVSSLTERGAMATLEALAMGAIDFVTKPGGTVSPDLSKVHSELLAKVRIAAAARVKSARAPAAAPKPRSRTAPSAPGAVLIGTSTGGPRALEAILPALPADFPWPLVIAQHMPAQFTGPFARRLDGVCALHVCEITSLEALQTGHAYVGRGAADLMFSMRAGQIAVRSRPENPDYAWHPSVDLMVQSALDHFAPSQLIGVLLTGMGSDGAAQMARLRSLGGRTIAESESSATVYGMPAELVKLDGADRVLPAEQVAGQLVDWVFQQRPRAVGG